MKRNISSGLSITEGLGNSDGDVQMQDAMQSSMEFTEKGSMLYKGFKINQGGVQISPDRTGEVSPFMLNDIKLMEELGRSAPVEIDAHILLFRCHEHPAERSRLLAKIA